MGVAVLFDKLLPGSNEDRARGSIQAMASRVTNIMPCLDPATPISLQNSDIKTGEVNVRAELNVLTSVSVAFPVPYPDGIIPTIHLTALTSDPSTNFVTVSSVTNTGFIGAYMRKTTSADMIVRWTAIAIK